MSNLWRVPGGRRCRLLNVHLCRCNTETGVVRLLRIVSLLVLRSLSVLLSLVLGWVRKSLLLLLLLDLRLLILLMNLLLSLLMLLLLLQLLLLLVLKLLLLSESWVLLGSDWTRVLRTSVGGCIIWI